MKKVGAALSGGQNIFKALLIEIDCQEVDMLKLASKQLRQPALLNLKVLGWSTSTMQM